MTPGFFLAFCGGVLSVFTPCSALLLPSFFAYAATTKARLALMGSGFLLGLCLTMLPLGFGLGWAGSALDINQETIQIVAGWVLIILGVLQIFGGGLDIGRLLPQRYQRLSHNAGPFVGSLVLGTLAGLTGACTGPILGAVLTFVLQSGSALNGMWLMFAYCLGIALPALALAAVWRQISPRALSTLRGRSFRLGPFQVHTSGLIIGVFFIVFGLLMLFSRGFLKLPDLLPAGLTEVVTSGAQQVDYWVGPIITPLLATVVAVGAFFWMLHQRAVADDAAAADDVVAEDEAADDVVAAEADGAGGAEPAAEAERDAESVAPAGLAVQPSPADREN